MGRGHAGERFRGEHGCAEAAEPRGHEGGEFVPQGIDEVLADFWEEATPSQRRQVARSAGMAANPVGAALGEIAETASRHGPGYDAPEWLQGLEWGEPK